MQTPRLTLLSLSLRNFKGCRELTIVPNGLDFSIYGDNAVGKTTVADAWFWLLFGKDSANRADFEIKTLVDGKPAKGLNHEVEAVLLLPAGNELTLLRSYKEVWTKARGYATAEFTGNTTEFFVNGVPVQKKEYDAMIASVCDEKRFRLLTDPLYFNTVMSWQDRRRILLEVCGDVSDAEVIASNPELSDLPSVLGSLSLDDYRKVAQSKMTKINDELKAIPIKIAEADRSIPQGSFDVPDAEPLRAKLAKLQEDRANIVAGGAVAEVTKRLREVEGEIQQAVNRVTGDHGAKLQSKRNEGREATAKMEDAKAAVSRIESQIKIAETDLASLLKRREEKVDEFKAVNATVFEPAVSPVCPTCDQPLPQEKVAEANEKALAEFNFQKSSRLERNKAEGQSIKSQIERLQSDLAGYESKLEAAKADVAEYTARREALVAEMAELESAKPDLLADEDYASLLDVKSRCEETIERLKADTSDALAKKDGEIAEAQEAVRQAEEAAANLRQKDSLTARIDDLKGQERKLSAEYEELERHTFLCEEFLRTKVSMLDERINSKFSLVRFKMFDQQVNGGLAECCEATVGGVPYRSNLNHGARINAGLDIINTLAAHYGFAPPVVIDGCESVTRLVPTLGQVGRLVVSEQDKKLRFETVEAQASKKSA